MQTHLYPSLSNDLGNSSKRQEGIRNQAHRQYPPYRTSREM